MGHYIAEINKRIESGEKDSINLEKLMEKHKVCNNYCYVPNFKIPEEEAEEACADCKVLKALKEAWNLGYRAGINSAIQVIQR